MKSYNESKNLYDGYSDWKNWIPTNDAFFSCTTKESQEFVNQFNKCKVVYSNLKVLEIGFGAGKLLKFLDNHQCSIEGVEVQDKLLQLARLKEIKVYEDFNMVDGPYDLIIAFDVLEHLSVVQLLSLFKVMSTKLSVGGRLVFRYPNGDSYAGMASQNGDYTHLTSIGKSKLQQFIEPYGLEIKYYDGVTDLNNVGFLNFIKSLIRRVLISIMGFNIPYFFSGNVIAVVGYKIEKCD